MAEAIKNPICCRGNGEDSTFQAQWRICVYFFLLIFAGGLFILLEKTEKTQHILPNTLPAGEKSLSPNVTNRVNKSSKSSL